MLTVKSVYKLLNVSDDLKWTTNTHVTFHSLSTFQGITNNIYGFGRPFFAPSFFARPPPIHPYFYPNDGWTGLYIKLCKCTYILNTGCVVIFFLRE